MCISCKITPLKFNQQIYSFGQKLTAVFTKCHTDFEPVPTLEFMCGSDKGDRFILRSLSRDLKNLPLTKSRRKLPHEQYILINIFEAAYSGAA